MSRARNSSRACARNSSLVKTLAIPVQRLSNPGSRDRLDRRKLRRDRLAQALYVSADRAQLRLDLLVAAVYVIDAVDDCLALRRKPREHERRRSAQVGSLHTRAREFAWAFDDSRAMALYVNRSAHALHLRGVHEAVLEYRLGDARAPFGLRHKGHVLRLHVRREVRVRLGRHGAPRETRRGAG